MKDEKYLTRKEFCNYLRVSRSILATWIDSGLPKLQANGKGKLLIPLNKALAWLENDNSQK